MPACESTYAEIARRVQDFLAGRLLVRALGLKLEEDTPLLERRFIDSTGVLELVSFLEQEFGIIVADEEITPGNLNSVRRISEYVSQKSKAESESRRLPRA